MSNKKLFPIAFFITDSTSGLKVPEMEEVADRIESKGEELLVNLGFLTGNSCFLEL
jgi:hypothetical protein